MERQFNPALVIELHPLRWRWPAFSIYSNYAVVYVGPLFLSIVFW